MPLKLLRRHACAGAAAVDVALVPGTMPLTAWPAARLLMSASDDTPAIDWSLTIWEGARREQHRRWANLSLREIVLALEEMQVISRQELAV